MKNSYNFNNANDSEVSEKSFGHQRPASVTFDPDNDNTMA